MTIRELFAELFSAASLVYDGREARSVAEFLAEKLYGADRISVAIEPHREIKADGLERVLTEISAGRPAQYIAGRADFCGMEFEVTEGVLIPRPETEELVQWVTAEAAPGATVLDIGTGSGAIAIALARTIARSDVHAVDISGKALGVARRNSAENGAQVSFLHYDILAPDGEMPWPAGTFDVVVSNPPYIPVSDMAAMHQNVTGFEPHEALFVPDGDALVFYKAIARKGRSLLRPGGRLYFEIYEHSAGEVACLLTEAGYSDIEVRQDMNGRDRMVKAVKR